jgi:uncharacterized protein (DUF924 family)
MGATPADAQDVLVFWRAAGPKKWFAKDTAFDATFRDRFALLHEKAARGDFMHWRATPEGALAEILLLDQYPRNAFRDTPRAFATDARALESAKAMLDAGHDKALPDDVRAFAYLPFDHSENLADQDRAVELLSPISENHAYHARAHRDLIVRFGRFPHRNAILGRESTAEETAFLAEGGYRP